MPRQPELGRSMADRIRNANKTGVPAARVSSAGGSLLLGSEEGRNAQPPSISPTIPASAIPPWSPPVSTSLPPPRRGRRAVIIGVAVVVFLIVLGVVFI
jgi:hypothetical protein